MDDLIAFLESHWAVAESNAERTLADNQRSRQHGLDSAIADEEDADARWTLADIDAKRRILAALQPDLNSASGEVAQTELGPELVRWAKAHAIARFLSLPYADHPDYQEAWRP